MKSLVTMTLAAILLLGTLSTLARPSDPTIAFRGVDVFDGSRMIRRTTVLVRDGMIRAAGTRQRPRGSATLTLDELGRTLVGTSGIFHGGRKSVFEKG